MAKPLDIGELRSTLSSCVDSAPGLDGIPYSFYAAFPDLLLKYVLDSWNFALQGNGLTSSHKSSCITLLPKKGKDLSSIGNWRPISLSSCDLKVITKSYANRLKQILPDILSEAQAAYTPGRDISFNNRIILGARKFAIRQGLDFCLTSLDAQKAFDSVSHDYLEKVLKYYDFPQEFIDVFGVLYSDLQSVVQVNGFLSKEFPVRRGVKQGDALSCGLFVLAIDPLLRNIQANDNIEGLDIKVRGAESVEVKVLSYADDVAVICRNGSLQPIFTEYERFSTVSGLVLNADKTEVLNFIPSRFRSSRISYMGQRYDLNRVDRIRICGIWLTSDEREEYKLNVMDRISIMESMVLSWGRRHLTMNGRMIIAKTFLMSQIVFPAQVLSIKKPEIKKIEKLIYGFVNGAKSLYGPERIARLALKAPKELGGINGIDVDSFIKAIVVKQYGKAAKGHKLLALLQSLAEAPIDNICVEARAVLRLNCRNFVEAVAMPDLGQLETISRITASTLLNPGTRAAKFSDLLQIDSMGDLQLAYNDHRIPRASISVILKAISRPIAELIRSGMLTQSPGSNFWFGSDTATPLEAAPNKAIKLTLLQLKAPTIGVKLEKVYKRGDWPPPGVDSTGTFSNIWRLKNPSLRAIRLKTIYKDIFSNERRYRFNISPSPGCDVCGQLETVEHQLYSCGNARRVWNLFYRLSGINIGSLYEVLICTGNLEVEIVKSIMIKSLIQIDRSLNRSDREIISECSYYLGIEAKANAKHAARLQLFSERLSRH